MKSHKALDKVRHHFYTLIMHYHIDLCREAQKPLDDQHDVLQLYLRPEDLARQLDLTEKEVDAALKILKAEGLLDQHNFKYRDTASVMHYIIYSATDRALQHKDTVRDLKNYKYPVEP